MLLKEVQNEVYSESNMETIGDIESAPNLNHCRENVAGLINTFLQDSGAGKKVDKVGKAQDVVEQAKKLMGENVKKMIDNQKDFNVSIQILSQVEIPLNSMINQIYVIIGHGIKEFKHQGHGIQYEE